MSTNLSLISTGKLISEYYLKNMTKVDNMALLREIDPHGQGLKFAGKLECIANEGTGQLLGYYKMEEACWLT